MDSKTKTMLKNNILDNAENKISLIDNEVKEILEKYSDKSIEYFLNLIVFPSLDDSGDSIKKQKLYDFYQKDDKNYIKTGNLAGFIRLDNKLDFRIKSRFGGEKDYFLQYMICKVFNVNITNLAYSVSKSDELSVMALLFLPAYIMKAYRKGLFRSYKCFKRNDDKVRGAIDVARHIRQNPLFNGKIAYTSREYSYDNHITQLLRHAIEYARTLEIGKSLLSHNLELAKALQEIECATPSYAIQRRNEIINTNKKPFSHPYYSEYADLQKLCLMILRQKGIDFTCNGNENIQGIIFNTSWLWEEYLYSVIKPLGFKHPNNRKKLGKIDVFKTPNDFCGFHYYPDFYKENIVLDAKYKELDKNIKDNEKFTKDFEKMLIYMFLLKTKKGVFVYPSKDKKINEAKLNGYGEDLCVYSFFVPQNSENLSDFCSSMEEEEKKLINFINS